MQRKTGKEARGEFREQKNEACLQHMKRLRKLRHDAEWSRRTRKTWHVAKSAEVMIRSSRVMSSVPALCPVYPVCPVYPQFAENHGPARDAAVSANSNGENGDYGENGERARHGMSRDHRFFAIGCVASVQFFPSTSQNFFQAGSSQMPDSVSACFRRGRVSSRASSSGQSMLPPPGGLWSSCSP